jgi:putative ABC transport system ATP-binding protein
MKQLPLIIQAQDLFYEISSNDSDIRILQGLNLEIAAQEQVAIIGSSGSGKSTLLSLLAGLDVPTKGNVQIQGSAFSQLDEDGRAMVRSQ